MGENREEEPVMTGKVPGSQIGKHETALNKEKKKKIFFLDHQKERIHKERAEKHTGSCC